jgi:hypothetical protein
MTRRSDEPAAPLVTAAVAPPPKIASAAPIASPNPAPVAKAPTVVISGEQGAAIADKLESTRYVWTEPENLGRKVNDGGSTRSPTLTADQLCLIVDRPPGNQSDLVEFHRASIDAPWGPPIYSAGTYHEEFPSLSAEGLQLLFNSTSSQGLNSVGGHDLYLLKRPTRDAPWGPVESLGTLNTPYDEGGASLSPNGLLLAFHSNRPGGMGGDDVWIARRPSLTAPFGPPENLGRTVNSGAYDSNPHIIDDTGRLYFERGGDLFVTFQNASGATSAISLPNQTEKFYKSWLSPDGSALYFHANRRGGLGADDVWVTYLVPRNSPEAKRIPKPVEEEQPPKIEAAAHNGHAYQWVREPALTWFDAERIAKSMGGHLATFQSAEESEWVKNTLMAELAAEQMAWIGALKNPSGSWEWITGEPFQFTDWNPGEGGDGGASAAGIARRVDGFGWADWAASSRAIAQTGPIRGQSRNVGFIVEWDAPNPTLPPKPAPPP